MIQLKSSPLRVIFESLDLKPEVLIYCFGFFASVILATAQERTPEGFVYEKIYYNEMSIIGYDGVGGEITIPAMIEDFPVTSIGSQTFMYNDSLLSVSIPSGLNEIGDFAFHGCSSLSSVVFEESGSEGYNASYIGEHAFSGCYNLVSISIPERFIGIGGYAFEGCSSLSSVVLEDSGSGEYYNSYMGSHAFAGCSSLVRISIPERFVIIGAYAFEGCSGLSSVVFEGSGSGWYDYSIEWYAFAGCDSLTSVRISNNFTYIGDYAFADCHLLRSTSSYDDWGPEYEYEVFIIPDSVEEIGDGAFSNCSSLMSIYMGESVTRIGDYAFDGCYSLRYSMPDLFDWDWVPWDPMFEAEGIVIPSSVDYVGRYAFAGCESVTQVSIGGSVDHIGDHAFDTGWWASSVLETVRFVGEEPSSVGTDIFGNVSEGFIVIYPATALGFGSPTWLGYPTRIAPDEVPPADIMAAIEIPDTDGESDGSVAWGVDSNTKYYGDNAACSGIIRHNEISVLRASVSIPEDVFYGLSFFWKVSSEAESDFLSFSINGVEQSNISGEVDWEQQVFFLRSGLNTLEWRYSKDYTGNSGFDAGWVDYVRLHYNDGGVPILGMPFSDWVAALGLSGLEAGPDSDPDGDGIANLLEYAFGTSAITATPALARPSIRVDTAGTSKIFTYTHRRLKNSGLNISYLVSPDLSAPLENWASLNVSPVVTNTDLDGDGRVEEVSVSVPLGEMKSQFLVLSAEEADK